MADSRLHGVIEPHPFASAIYSVRHAKRRLDELHGYLVAFRDSQPYGHVVERDLERGFKSHKIKLLKELPEPIAGTIFDVANNLRCALDQAGFAIAVAVGKSGNNAHFPFGDSDKASASCHIAGRSKDLPQEIFDTMMASKPYKRGNRFLWAVNELANTHKHEVIVQPVTVQGVSLVRGKRYPGIEPAAWPPRWDRVKNEMEIARAPLDSTDKVEFHGQLAVGIGQIKELGNSAAMDILDRMHLEVTHQAERRNPHDARNGGWSDRPCVDV